MRGGASGRLVSKFWKWGYGKTFGGVWRWGGSGRKKASMALLMCLDLIFSFPRRPGL